MIKVLFTIGAIQLLQMVVLLARTKGLALLLGPELLGVLAVIDKLIAVFAQTASLSLPFAALRFLPSLWASNPREFYRRLRGMSTLLLGLSCLADGRWPRQSRCRARSLGRLSWRPTGRYCLSRF